MEDEKKEVPNAMKIIFGAFMVLIYLGMGILMLINFFDWQWAWARYGLGLLFIVYGFWRGYREYKKR
ncbi:MAG: hypothetical protein PHR45_01850 [Muribaculaceae bacterium]|nr:hypothetical protein [Muribaculaceae bacterium]